MSSEVQKIQILHPRPSSIVAALYTLRDLGADVIILHGPSGCCFKHARLLEEDGVRVLTTSLDEAGFVFGGQESLTKLLKKAKDLFNPRLMAVSGTCSSMIIGDDLHQAVLNANLDVPILEVEVHAGYRDNTQGVIICLEAARDMGIIDETEFQRQKSLLDKATEVEKLYGAASDEYLPPERGDVKYEVAARLLKLVGAGKCYLINESFHFISRHSYPFVRNSECLGFFVQDDPYFGVRHVSDIFTFGSQDFQFLDGIHCVGHNFTQKNVMIGIQEFLDDGEQVLTGDPDFSFCHSYFSLFNI